MRSPANEPAAPPARGGRSGRERRRDSSQALRTNRKQTLDRQPDPEDYGCPRTAGLNPDQGPDAHDAAHCRSSNGQSTCPDR
jgi:hypothetical protein